METFQQQQQQFSNQQFDNQQFPQQNFAYQQTNQESIGDNFQQRYGNTVQSSGQTAGIQEHYNPNNYMPQQQQNFQQFPTQGSTGQMSSFQNQRQHQINQSSQFQSQQQQNFPNDLPDISQLSEHQRQNLVQDILKGSNMGQGLFSATQLLNQVQQPTQANQSQQFINSKQAAPQQQLPLQTQSQNTPQFQQQQFPDTAPQTQQLNITQMYQNLNHYQTMLKEIEQHNNKPLSSGIVSQSNQDPTPKPFQPSSSFLNQGNFKDKAGYQFDQQQNQSFYQNQQQQQNSLKESPSKDYLRTFNNQMNESSISGFRQDSGSKYQLKPEKSNSPPREAFQVASQEQSFHNRSKNSIRESNQENIPSGEQQVTWPSQLPTRQQEDTLGPERSFQQEHNSSSYNQQHQTIDEPMMLKRSQNFDEQPLPTSKPKTFEELLAENLGGQPIESEPAFQETSNFGGQSDNQPKKQFLKRKTANVQAPVAKKKYNYYADKFNEGRSASTTPQLNELQEDDTKSTAQRATSREATQITERQSSRNASVQKKPFLSKGKGSGGGNKKVIAPEKSPHRDEENHTYHGQNFSPKSGSGLPENNRYGRSQGRNPSGRHMEEEEARSSIAEFEKLEQQCNDRYSPVKQQTVDETSHQVEQDSPQQQQQHETGFRDTQTMKQNKKVFSDSDSEDEQKHQKIQMVQNQHRQMVQQPKPKPTAMASREQKEQIEQAIQRGLQSKQQELDQKLEEAHEENDKCKKQKVFLDQQLAKFRLDQREFENKKKREMEDLQRIKEEERERNAKFRKELEKKQKNTQLVAQKDSKLKEENERLKKELQRMEESFKAQEQAYKKQGEKVKRENDEFKRQVVELSNEIQHIEELRECELNEVEQLKEKIAQQQIQIQQLEKQLQQQSTQQQQQQPKSILKQSKETPKEQPVQKPRREQDEFEVAAPHFGSMNTKPNQHQQQQQMQQQQMQQQQQPTAPIMQSSQKKEKSPQKKQAQLPRGVRIEEEKQPAPLEEEEPMAENEESVEKDEEEEEDYDMKFEDKYHAKNAANLKVLEQIIGNDGKIQRTFESGKKEIIFNNGVKRESFTDGYTIVYFNNNDIKQTYPDKKIVYYFAEAQTTQTTYADGLQVFKFQNGQIEKHYADGTKEISFPDGTIKCIFHDGEEESIFPDGTIQRIEKSGIKAIEFANGQKDILFPDGTRIREYPDGKIRKTLPTGEVETTYRN